MEHKLGDEAHRLIFKWFSFSIIKKNDRERKGLVHLKVHETVPQGLQRPFHLVIDNTHENAWHVKVVRKHSFSFLLNGQHPEQA